MTTLTVLINRELNALQTYARVLEKQIAYMKSPDYDPSKPLPAVKSSLSGSKWFLPCQLGSSR